MTIISRILPFIAAGAFLCTSAAQSVQDDEARVRYPQTVSNGILFTDSQASSLFLLRNDVVTTLYTARGSGMYVAVSADGKRAGLKSIDENGLQTPLVINVMNGTVERLHGPAQRAGQVSFSAEGAVAFTIGEELVVQRGGTEKRYTLGYYANVAPISPDGAFAAFNDQEDRIWILNLATGTRKEVSPDSIGCFRPRWSPDGTLLLLSSLDGNVYMYSLATEELTLIGEGSTPAFSPDSRTVVYTKREIERDRCINIDLYLSAVDGSFTTRLTDSPDLMETEPAFLDNETLIWNSRGTSELHIGTLSRTGQAPVKLTNRRLQHIAVPDVPAFNQLMKSGFEQSVSVPPLDIPYLHQVFDTPMWHNGYGSCAPTAAMMILAYYNILPPWEIQVTSPFTHYNYYGAYVADKYQFRTVNYANYQTTDYGGNVCWGAYGWMWYGSRRPSTYMAQFYRNSGITATQTNYSYDSEGRRLSFAWALSEVTAGRPFTLCVLLTTAGHLVIAHGTGSEEHTFIYNDPYGNKNQVYTNFNGKNVKYDWPGYNNGFANLNEVAWCISTSYTPIAPSDTLIDDLNFASGFVLRNKHPAHMSMWKDSLHGENGHAWYTLTTTVDTCYAAWMPNLPFEGPYEVKTFIPPGANAVARYRVFHNGTEDTVLVNQAEERNTWVSLGTFDFRKGKGDYLFLGTSSSERLRWLGVDAAVFNYKDTSFVTHEPDATPRSLRLEQNYPNPFNPSTSIEFYVPSEGHASLRIYDPLGQEIATLFNANVDSPGSRRVTFDASSLPSGVYIARLEFAGVSLQRKLLLIK